MIAPETIHEAVHEPDSITHVIGHHVETLMWTTYSSCVSSVIGNLDLGNEEPTVHLVDNLWMTRGKQNPEQNVDLASGSFRKFQAFEIISFLHRSTFDDVRYSLSDVDLRKYTRDAVRGEPDQRLLAAVHHGHHTGPLVPHHHLGVAGRGHLERPLLRPLRHQLLHRDIGLEHGVGAPRIVKAVQISCFASNR